MNKAKKAIAERAKSVDMVIEMLDARMPASSENPLLAQLSKGKPKLKILNKQDLADPERTKIWLEHYNSRPDTRAIALDSSETGAHGKITQACRAMIPHRQGIDKPLRVLICGIPNVGKSTLINGMIGKKSAKTGNEPGITKAEQRLFLADDFWLYDTPGMLWPKIIVEEGGYNLAAGAVLSGGRVNYQKAAENILTDFREGKIGRITLETPNQWETWLKKARQKEAELKAIREARKAERKGQKPADE